MGRNDRNEFYCISKSFDSRNTVCPPSSPRDGEYSWGTFGSDTFDTRLSIFHPLVLSCCSRYSLRPINYFHEFMESDGSINLRGLTSGQPNCCWTFFPFFFFLIVRVSFDREILPAALARVSLEQRHQQPRPSKIPRVRDIYIHDEATDSPPPRRNSKETRLTSRVTALFPSPKRGVKRLRRLICRIIKFPHGVWPRRNANRGPLRDIFIGSLLVPTFPLFGRGISCSRRGNHTYYFHPRLALRTAEIPSNFLGGG